MKLLRLAVDTSAVLVCVFVLGCGEKQTAPALTTSSETSESGSGGSSSRDTPSEVEEIAVRIGDRAAYDELLAKHKGKVVLVDFWATWCPPCVEEFPHTVEVGKQADPAKMAVISVSMDEPEDKDKVLTFLKKKGASFDNMISKYGVGQEGFEAFEITDGAVPHYKVYDRTGKLRHTAGSNEKIDQLVEQLLNEG